MMRRRNVITIVGIAVIVTVLATVAVVFAAQQIFGTQQVSATVNIVTEADFLRVCGPSASSGCPTTFTGPLVFGDLARGDSKTVSFHVQHTGVTGELNLFLDARIRSGDQDTFLALGLLDTTKKVVSGDVPNLGHFKLERLEGGTLFDWDNALAPGQVRRIEVTYTSLPTLKGGPRAFDIVIDVVDTPE